MLGGIAQNRQENDSDKHLAHAPLFQVARVAHLLNRFDGEFTENGDQHRCNGQDSHGFP